MKTCEKLVRAERAAKISNIRELKSSRYFEFICVLGELEQIAKYLVDLKERWLLVRSPVRMFKRNERNKLQFFVWARHINFEQGLNKIHSLGTIQHNGGFTRRLKSPVDLIQIEMSVMWVTTSHVSTENNEFIWIFVVQDPHLMVFWWLRSVWLVPYDQYLHPLHLLDGRQTTLSRPSVSTAGSLHRGRRMSFSLNIKHYLKMTEFLSPQPLPLQLSLVLLHVHHQHGYQLLHLWPSLQLHRVYTYRVWECTVGGVDWLWAPTWYECQVREVC